MDQSSLIRVALLISMYFPPEPGGGAMTAFNRASILHKIGYRVFVLCGFPCYPNGKVIQQKYRGKFFYIEKMDDFTLIRFRLLPLASKGYLRRFILFVNFSFLSLIWLPKVLRICSNTELVYALAPIMFSSPIGFCYSKITRAFFIYEVSAFWPEELVAIKSNIYILLSFIGKIFAKVSYTFPDMLVVISNSAARFIVDNYHPKISVYPLPIGVDPDRYPTKDKESSRKKLIEKNILPVELERKFIVLYSGVITKVTKVENLVYVANKLKEENSIAFLVIGDGEEKEQLEIFRADNKINNLYIMPFQDGSLVAEIISAADLCVVPLSSESIYETTVPTKFFDYLACKKPQLGICSGEIANLMTSNNIGVAAKDGDIDKISDIILNLRDSPELMDSMAQNSAQVLQKYTLTNLASKFHDVLKIEIIRRNK